MLLGARPDEAEDAVGAGLARAYADWALISGGGDPDVDVYRTVLAAWAQAARALVGRPAGGADGAAGEPAPELAALERQLDRLTRDERLALVLRFAAGFGRVAGRGGARHGSGGGAGPAGPGRGAGRPDGAAGGGPVNALLVEEIFRDAVRSVETMPPPLHAFRERAAGELRRRRRRSVAGTTAALALVLLVVVAWQATRPGGGTTAATRPVVTMIENPADVAWWADGQLHLANVTVAVPLAHHVVTDLVEINGGAVYGDDTGAVAFVGDDGEVTRIGTKTPAARLVASDESGWVAWVDPRGRSPELVVYDLTARGLLARRTLPRPDPRLDGAGAGNRPIALDRDELYYADPGRRLAWTVPDGGTRAGAAGRAARRGRRRPGVAARTRRRIGSCSRSSTSASSAPAPAPSCRPTRPCAHPTVRGRASGGSFGTVRLYDVRSGESLWTGLTRRDVAVAATLGPETRSAT